MWKSFLNKLHKNDSGAKSSSIFERIRKRTEGDDNNGQKQPPTKPIHEQRVGHEPSPPTEESIDHLVGVKKPASGHAEAPPPLSPRELDRMDPDEKARVLQKENYALRHIIKKLQDEKAEVEADRRRLNTDLATAQEKDRQVYSALLEISNRFPRFLVFREQAGRRALQTEVLIEFLDEEVKHLISEIETQKQSSAAPQEQVAAQAPSGGQVQAPQPAAKSTPAPVAEEARQPEPQSAQVEAQTDSTADITDIRLLREVGNYAERLDDLQRKALTVIGSTGLARISHILRSEALDETEFGGRAGVTRRLNELKNMGMLKNERVNVGARGHMFSVFYLTDKGKAVYQHLTGQDPVKSEVDIILAEHASLEHGYLIKVVAEILEEQGYTVYQDRESCTFQVEDEEGRQSRIVFDLVAEDKKNDRRLYIEAERGTHNDDEFYMKLDKISAFTKEIHFVAPSDTIMHRDCRGRFNQWVLRHKGGKEYVDIAAYFSSLENLKKGKWSIINLRK